MISDLSALAGLGSLAYLSLSFNLITDVGALGGLTGLTALALRDNAELSDIQPLLNNVGLGSGDTVDLRSTAVSCLDVASLMGKGATVTSDCL
jgi:Leucine-rich repeat (LRR) protein